MQFADVAGRDGFPVNLVAKGTGPLRLDLMEVVATIAAAGAHDSDLFELIDVDGGDLLDADKVLLRTPPGRFLRVGGRGLGRVRIGGLRPDVNSVFTVVRTERPGLPVRSGDAIGLRSTSGRLVTWTADGTIRAAATGLGVSETLTIIMR